jgi:hypothetical protein
MELSSLQEETKLDDKLEKLLNQFEREVEPYDRFSAFSMFSTPVGIVLSIFLPLAYLQFVGGVNPFASMISRTKYKPIAGVCMCDLSQLRSHMKKMEKAKATGERMMHAKLVKYYKQQIGWE